MCTCVPPLKAPHVDVPVNAEKHRHGEYDHCKDPQDTHHHPKDHIEEEENVGYYLIETSGWEEEEGEGRGEEREGGGEGGEGGRGGMEKKEAGRNRGKE